MDLRVGVMVIAIINIIEGLLTIGIATGLTMRWGISIHFAAPVFVLLEMSGAWLLYGALEYHQTATIIHLIFSMVSVVSYGILAIFSFVLSSFVCERVPYHTVQCQKVQWAGPVVVGVFALIAALVQLYFWACAFTFLKKLKSGPTTPPA